MALPPEEELELIELEEEERKRSKPAPAPVQKAAPGGPGEDDFGSILNPAEYARKASVYALKQIAGGYTPFSAAGLTEQPSPERSLLLARTYQALPVTTWLAGGSEGEGALERMAEPAVTGLENRLGQTGAAAAQFGAGLLGNVPEFILSRGAMRGATSRAVPVAGKIAGGAAIGGGNAIMTGLLGSPEGRGLQEARETLLAPDPYTGVIPVAPFAGGLIAGLGHLGTRGVKPPSAAESVVDGEVTPTPWHRSRSAPKIEMKEPPPPAAPTKGKQPVVAKRPGAPDVTELTDADIQPLKNIHPVIRKNPRTIQDPSVREKAMAADAALVDLENTLAPPKRIAVDRGLETQRRAQVEDLMPKLERAARTFEELSKIDTIKMTPSERNKLGMYMNSARWRMTDIMAAMDTRITPPPVDAIPTGPVPQTAPKLLGAGDPVIPPRPMLPANVQPPPGPMIRGPGWTIGTNETGIVRQPLRTHQHNPPPPFRPRPEFPPKLLKRVLAGEEPAVRAVNAFDEARKVPSSEPPEPPAPPPREVLIEAARASKVDTTPFWTNRDRDPGGKTNWRKKLLSSRTWASEEQRASMGGRIDEAGAIMRWKQAQMARERMMQKVYPEMRKEFNADPFGRSAARRFIDETMNREIHKGEKPSIEQLPPSIARHFKRTADLTNEKVAELLEAGVFNPTQAKYVKEQILTGGIYIHRTHEALARGKRYVPNDVLVEQAIKQVMKRFKMDDAQATHYLGELLGDIRKAEGTGSIEHRTQGVGMRRDVLKEKSKIPPAVLRLLRPIDDPPLALAMSIAEVEQLHAQYTVTKTYASPEYRGLVWDGPGNPVFNRQVPPDRVAYGELAGKWVSEPMYEALTEAPGQMARDNIEGAVLSWMGAWKFGKVVDPGVIARDLMQNTVSMAGAGLAPDNLRWAPQRLKEAIQGIHQYNKWNPASADKKRAKLGDFGALYKLALDHGAIHASHATELGQGAYIGRQIDLEARRVGPDRYEAMVGRLLGAKDLTAESLIAVRNLADTVPRFMAFIHNYERLRPHMSQEMAADRASYTVNQYFASAGNLSRPLQNLVRKGAWISPLGGWGLDMIRVSGNIARLALMPPKGIPRQDGLAALFRISRTMAWWLLGLPAAAAFIYGVSDEEKEAMRENQRPWDKTSGPGVAPIGRDERGRLVGMDYNQALYWSALTRGDPKHNIGARIAGNFAEMQTRGGLLQTAGEWTHRALAFEPGFQEREAVVDEQFLRQAGKEVEQFLMPTVWNSYKRLERRTNEEKLRLAEEPLSNTQAFTQFMTGARVVPVGQATVIGNARSLAGEINRLTNHIRTVNLDKELTEEQKTREVNAVIARIAELEARATKQAQTMGPLKLEQMR